MSIRTIAIGIGVLLLVLLTAGCIETLFPPAKNEFHIHADIAIYLNGQKVNLAQEKYMSDANHALNPFTHLHDMDGNVVHVHARNVSMGMFLESIGMKLEKECFTMDTGEKYCSNDANKLYVWINGAPEKIFVNGAIIENPADYVMQDLDQILITYGNETLAEQNNQFDSVTDNACIDSKKCPERGDPADEGSCTTGSGCDAGPIKTGP